MKCPCVLLAVFALLSLGISAEKLKVDLYVEALCPYCQRYVVTKLKPLFENGLADAMDFNVYYSGNAKLIDGKLKCQHGAAECYLNRLMHCGISRCENVSQWFPFIVCIEEHAQYAVDEHSTRKQCAELVGLDTEELETCADGKEGEALHMAAFYATQSLKPPHRWVPWMVVNDMPVYDLLYALDKLLCLNIPEKDRPNECYEQDPTELNYLYYSAFRTYADWPNPAT